MLIASLVVVIAVLCAVLFLNWKKSNSVSGVKIASFNVPKPSQYPPPPAEGMEFMANVLLNFPERVENSGSLEGKFGWMDAEFSGIDNSEIETYDRADFDTSTMAGFEVTDKNGVFFDHCYVEKDKLGDKLLSLKDGDKIRLLGQAVMVLRPGTDATFDIMFRVDSIQVLN